MRLFEINEFLKLFIFLKARYLFDFFLKFIPLHFNILIIICIYLIHQYASNIVLYYQSFNYFKFKKYFRFFNLNCFSYFKYHFKINHFYLYEANKTIYLDFLPIFFLKYYIFPQ